MRSEDEILCGELGVVRVADVAAALGDSFSTTRRVRVRMLLAAGAMVDADVLLVDAPVGIGEHRLLKCPACGAAARLLRAGPTGDLCCARCRPHRTARQLERSTRWWRHHGGREFDEFLRLARKPGAAKLKRMRELAALLTHADRQRTDELQHDVDTLEEGSTADE